MSVTFNTKTYTADSFQQNIIGYVGASNTNTVKDQMVLKRTAAKATPVFSGVARSNLKLVKTLTLTGAKTATGDFIADCSFSNPVGSNPTDVDNLMADLGAAIIATFAKNMVKNGTISN